MTLSFKNTKGENYFIKMKLTKKGNPSYYMTRKGGNECLKEIPEGYEIFEKYDSGMVFIRKKKEKVFNDYEIEIIEKELRENKSVYNYKLDNDGKLIKIYTIEKEEERDNSNLLSRMFRDEMILSFKRFEERMRIYKEEDGFELKRYCYRGSIDDWITIDWGEDIEKIAKKNLKHLGKASYYDLM